MNFLGTLSTFDHRNNEWQIYKGKLNQFLKINNIVDKNKSGILLCHLTEETYRLMLNLAFPDELGTLSFEDLVKLLDDHFKPRKCTFVDKAKFFGASRESGETVGEWAARLRGLATYCDFGTALETNLRDRFVLGLSAGPERDKLFEQNPSTLTLSRAIEMAEQAAYAKEAKALIGSSEPLSIKEEPVFRAKFQGQASRARGAGGGGGGGAGAAARGDMELCEVCGMKNHSATMCRYRSYKCQKCGVKGHLKKVCGNKKGATRVYHADYVDSSKGGRDDQPQDQDCDECQNFNIRCSKLSGEE
ncbi:hypothetical protein PYW07_009395 [Mythimna separata]|uniref:CCHC-type domain-containing protein n=1 Tax=Mythimna separata TaxID=271217 RepID=A0AAD8DMK2_MYTSE|nr:hypothetical protein PYW07_009395 [Mythimna separata]